MKKSFLLVGLSVIFLWMAGCKEPTIDEGILPFVEPATVDPDGGSWRTIVLKSAADITVPTPTVITSNTYQKELTDIKKWVAEYRARTEYGR